MGLLPGNTSLHVAASFIWRIPHSLTWVPQMLRGQGKGVCPLSSPVRESHQELRTDAASRLQGTRAGLGTWIWASRGGNAWSRCFGKRSEVGRLPAALNVGKVQKQLRTHAALPYPLAVCWAEYQSVKS